VSLAVEELARECRGKIKVKKVSVGKNSLAPGRFGIRSIATRLLFKVGPVIDTIIGDAPQESREDPIKRVR